ncbi:hypothetical protein A9995_09625 [Erythrobacter sp. QSSC1-22B]|uniref:LytTR family DNA-binding domain-containing protein n=1 Tax=Erythrobacter sp. QSSC1-22B TaxID=1860125 RepID=UPI000805F685|nr:LytTR family DNA-binding domain-containing protein [Erythrobacter sp. QSSC1-22B]OBX18813.1 hypothetical protein A9995_09625 [Erythrobacter sp. QSSC1-22B]
MPLRLLLVLLLAMFAAPVAAQSVATEVSDLRACSDVSAKSPDGINPETCNETRISEIDPQGRLLWVLGTVHLSMESEARPLGLYLSGKMAGSVWWNGYKLGDDGRPGSNADTELPGRMDAVFFVPPALVLPGANHIAIHMSGMHGYFHLDQPVHWIGVAPYEQPAHLALVAYWPSLITFGAFVAAALYFGAMAVRGRDTAGSALLTAMSIFAAGQLFAEVSRGLWGYSYPVHDLRLSAIFACSLGFGLSLFGYLWSRFVVRRLAQALAAVAIVAVVVALVTPGFDGKTMMMLLVPTTIGIAALGWWSLQRRPGALVYLAALATFAGLIVWARFEFLDRHFYFAVAALLGFLFVRQAVAFVAEEERRIEETARAGRLDAALDRARQRDKPVRVSVAAMGRTDLILADDIVHCRGADDYVELILSCGRTLLHGGTLNELEETLPSTFLRVHRSHIVNTGFVSALTRDPSGTGSLAMQNGDSVRVSRRVMPRVKAVLVN